MRKLKDFNYALLGKWCWRMLVDRGGFWYRVLVARYGESDGRLEVGGRSVSKWWRELAKISDGVGEGGGGWLSDRVFRRVGNGRNTLFWTDRWVGDVSVCMSFSRLFDLTLNKSSTVADMYSLGWEVGGEAWRWRRRLWVWEEEMVEEGHNLLNDFIVQTNVTNRWQWLPNITGGYTVRGAYQILTSNDNLVLDDTGALVWHKQVPLKVSILAWRLLRDRLPTKNNLLRRDILHNATILCVAGCGNDESTSHLFLHSDSFGSLWQHIRNWLGVSGVDPYNICDHFIQFTNSLGISTKRRSLMQLMWLLCVWIIWTKRNNIIFNNIQTLMLELMKKIKHYSFWWLKANKTIFVFASEKWWSDPLQYLGVD